MTGRAGEGVSGSDYSDLRHLRVLHLGNIANNAYSNAKFLRWVGIPADAVSCDYRHVMAQPEWEDAPLGGEVDELEPDWSRVDLGGYVRPEWFRDIELKGLDTDGRALSGPGLLAYWIEHSKTRAAQRLEREGLHRNPGHGWSWPDSLRARARVLSVIPWAAAMLALSKVKTRLEQSRVDPYAWGAAQRQWLEDLVCAGRVSRADLRWALPQAAKLRGLLAGYDLIQAYGTEPIGAMLCSGGRPYVAFEHGTLRDLPFEPSPRGRLLAEAYRRAAKVVITNPDVRRSADRLGLTRYTFIPHPIDEERIAPGPSAIGQRLHERFPGALIILGPSRQNWAIKGSDRLVKAFARLLASGRKAVLFLARWGQEVDRTENLARELGVAGSVEWFRPAHKALLLDYYRGADLVCDQFVIGSFGGIAPEAMAVGKPVIVHYDDSSQRWSFPEPPPLLSASSVEEIFDAMLRIHDDEALRRQLGEASREWVARWHGWRRVVADHAAIYREIVNSGPGPSAFS
jgi:glycosyltransferase involved in cell wall biosynthesis